MHDDPLVFQCQIESSNPAKTLSLEILVDGKQAFYTAHVTQATQVQFNIDDIDVGLEYDLRHLADRELTFVMSGKGSGDTKIDESGNIVEDVVLTISGIKIDDVDLTQLISDKSVYTHNSNGFGDEVAVKFFGQMGCNGRVSFKFATPFYDWLLKNS